MNVLDLFAGIGGIREGAELAGAKIIGSVEFDKYARTAYQAIHDTQGEWTRGDITKVTKEEWANLAGVVDTIVGGFPCQPFSIAGRRQGFQDATKGNLFYDIARAVEQIRPNVVLLENVKGILSIDKGRAFATVLATLDELGYDSEWRLVDSQGFGVPQHRERVVIIGHLRSGAGRTEFVLPHGGTNGEDIVQAKRVEVINGTSVRQIDRVYNGDGIAPTLNTMQGGGKVPKVKINSLTLPEYSRHGKRGDDGLAMTLTATDYKTPPRIKSNGRIRKITPREAWRLQGFTDEQFAKAKATGLSNTQLYKQAGNSVTVPVFKFVFDRLKEKGQL